MLTHNRVWEGVQVKRPSWVENVLTVEKYSEVRLGLLLGGCVAMPPGRLLEEVIDSWGHLLDTLAPMSDQHWLHVAEDLTYCI